MKLLGNRIIVQEEQMDRIGMIHLPKSIHDPNFGGPKVFRVLTVGPGRKTSKGALVPIECSVGDRVICHSYTTGPADLGDGKLMITDDQILAVLPRNPAPDENNGDHQV